MNREEAIDFVQHQLSTGSSPEQAAQALHAETGAPVDLATQFVEHVLKKHPVNHQAEMEKLILARLASQQKKSDIILQVCEKTGMDWKEVENWVNLVEAQNHRQLISRKNALFIPLAILTILAGIFLIISSTDSIFNYILVMVGLEQGRAVLGMPHSIDFRSILTGAGLLLGGCLGLILAIQEQLK